MGFFFTRSSSSSKKAKKDSPPSSRDQKWAPPHYKPRPPPPPGQSWYGGDAYQLPPPQPIGLLPAPPGWVPQSPTQYQQPNPYPAPIVVNQHHYYLGPAPPSPTGEQASASPPSKLNLGSVLDLAKEICPNNGVLQTLDNNLPALQECGTQLINQTAALVDQISDRFNDVMTLIDGDRYVGNERDLFAWQPSQSHAPSPSSVTTVAHAPKSKPKSRTKDQPKGQTTAVAASVISGSFFAKVELYANSKLPLDLQPLRL